MKKLTLLTLALTLLAIVCSCATKQESSKSANSVQPADPATADAPANSGPAAAAPASDDRCAKIEGRCIDTNITAGTTVSFGNYPQETDAPAPLQWRVLEVDRTNQKVLLLSKFVIDAKPYNTEKKSVTWENCSLRGWLNGDFRNAAFSAEEQQQIVTTHLTNPDNSFNGTAGGHDTDDDVFLLSLEDARNPAYFTDSASIEGIPVDEITDMNHLPNESARDARTAKATMYVVNKNAIGTSAECAENGCTTLWWLRSPGYDAGYAAHVGRFGDVSDDGRSVNNEKMGVRPALWVRL